MPEPARLPPGVAYPIILALSLAAWALVVLAVFSASILVPADQYFMSTR